MVLFLLLTLILQKDKVVQRCVTFGTLGSSECCVGLRYFCLSICLFFMALGFCSPWWLLDSASELLSGSLELCSGATDPS